jgi:uncharacterized protein YbjT (DUF2867 family)
MARVFVLGATGGVGSRLCAQLLARGDQVVGLHRNVQQGPAMRAQGIEPTLGDLTSMSVDDLSARIRGASAVVFAAGASSDGPKTADAVDGRGVVLAAQAALEAGVSRFLLVSAFPDAWRDKRMPPDFEHYMKVKRQADVDLAATALDWIIVRPGTLTTGRGVGRVRLGAAIPYDEISRDDLAAVLVNLVHAARIRRVILEVTRGQSSMSDALQAVVDVEKTRCADAPCERRPTTHQLT